MGTPYPKALEQFPTLRQSRLARFDACGLSAKFAEEYERGWSTSAQARGHIFHAFAAKALLTMQEEGEEKIPVDVAIAILTECLRQADVDDRDLVTIPSKEIADLRWVVVKFAHDNTFSVHNLVGVEVPLVATIHYPNPEGGFVERKLTGRLDALFVEGHENHRAVVIDWKETFGMPPASKISEGGYFQQRFYAFLIMKAYPQVQEVVLREFYPRYSEVREATVGRNRLDEIEGELAALAERFDRAHERGAWSPSPGSHCAYCPRPSACPIFPSARREGSLASQEEAERVAAELVVAQAVVKQRQEALKVWANTHGPIAIKNAKGPKAYGYREAKRTKKPDRKVLEAKLAASGAQVDLDEVYVQETYTRFEAHTPQERDPAADDAALLKALEESLARAKK